MAKVVLDCPRILAVIGELVAATMPQHVGMHQEPEPRSLARPRNHALIASYAQWRAEAERKAETDPVVAQKLAELDTLMAQNKARPASSRAVAPEPGGGDFMIVVIIFGSAVLIGLWMLRRRAAAAAHSLLRAVGYGAPDGPLVPIGAGVYSGLTYVGNVGGGVVDFTALGDTVNTAARLASAAKAGEVLLGEEVHASGSGELFPNLEQKIMEVRGKEAPLAVRAWQPFPEVSP